MNTEYSFCSVIESPKTATKSPSWSWALAPCGKVAAGA